MEIAEIYRDLPILETERLILRKVTQGDLGDMNEYGMDPEVAKSVMWNQHGSLADTQDFMDFVLKRYADHDVAPWGIEYKENGKMIGTIDFVWWKPSHRTAEIGYTLNRAYWGKGLMTEASRQLISFGFEKMKLVRIQAVCFSDNIGSARVMEKSGLTYEGTLRKSMFIKDEHRDLKIYSIIRE